MRSVVCLPPGCSVVCLPPVRAKRDSPNRMRGQQDGCGQLGASGSADLEGLGPASSRCLRRSCAVLRSGNGSVVPCI